MKKQYADTRNSREAMGRLRTDLRDVQNIMVTNIQDVMSRGEALTGERPRSIPLFIVESSRLDLNRKATHLASMSQQYRKDAHYLNRMSSLTKVGLAVGSIVILSLIAYVFIF
jgi:vesicle transport protein SEC22